MFTGLIREIGRLQGLRPGGVTRLDIAAPSTAARVAPGDSVAVQGIWLTVTRVRGGVFSVEAAAETRRVTTLTDWRRGRRLHLEPALRAGDPLDGHLVQGHVDGVGRVLRVKRTAGSVFLTVGLDPDLVRYLTPKGSVAVDGVSLTVDAGPHRDRFTVNLIPHTLAATTFGDARTGRRVNLEMDVLVKAASTGRWADLPGIEPHSATPENPSRPPVLDRLLASGFTRLRSKGRS